MAITSQALLASAGKQALTFSVTTQGQTGGYGSGNTTSPGNTTSGVVPTQGTLGYPAINPYGAGQTGYLSKALFRSQLVGLNMLRLMDCVYKVGAFSFGANAALSAQPAIPAARVPNGDYRTCQLWVELVTTWTGTPVFSITYLNENGVQHTTPDFTFSSWYATVSNPVLNGAAQIPLAAGDYGIQEIVSVVEKGGGTAGTFNIAIMRELLTLGMELQPQAQETRWFDPLATGMVEIDQNAALHVMNQSQSSTRTNIVHLEISQG